MKPYIEMTAGELQGELMELKEDRGGSTVIRRHEEDLILLETEAQELTDVDTPEALQKLY